jgi:hypothetical protein
VTADALGTRIRRPRRVSLEKPARRSSGRAGRQLPTSPVGNQAIRRWE